MNEVKKEVMPRARQEALLVHELTNEVLVYDLRSHKAHSLNRTATLVWNSCDGTSTVAAIANLLEREVGAQFGVDVVSLALKQLHRARLVEEGPHQNVVTEKVRRRDLLRGMGIAAATSLPLVLSIVTPTSAQTASCRAAGQPCTQNSQCCSGNCLGQGNGTCHA